MATATSFAAGAAPPAPPAPPATPSPSPSSPSSPQQQFLGPSALPTASPSAPQSVLLNAVPSDLMPYTSLFEDILFISWCEKVTKANTTRRRVVILRRRFVAVVDADSGMVVKRVVPLELITRIYYQVVPGAAMGSSAFQKRHTDASVPVILFRIPSEDDLLLVFPTDSVTKRKDDLVHLRLLRILAVAYRSHFAGQQLHMVQTAADPYLYEDAHLTRTKMRGVIAKRNERATSDVERATELLRLEQTQRVASLRVVSKMLARDTALVEAQCAKLNDENTRLRRVLVGCARRQLQHRSAEEAKVASATQESPPGVTLPDTPSDAGLPAMKVEAVAIADAEPDELVLEDSIESLDVLDGLPGAVRAFPAPSAPEEETHRTTPPRTHTREIVDWEDI